MIKLVVFAALVSVALAGGKKCPWVNGVSPFDEAKFVGEWNVVAGSPMIGGPHNCGKFAYKISKDVHTLKYTGQNPDGSTATGEAFGQAISKGDKASSNYLAVWRKDNDPFSPVFKQTIVSTDYENYALLLACTNVYDDKSKSFVRVIKAGILARPGKTLSPETIGVLKSVLTGLDFNVNDLKFPEKVGC